MANIAGPEIAAHRVAGVMDLMVGETVADQRKQLIEAGARAERNIEDLALRLIVGERGANSRR